jgi:type I restriction enzyme S subunit
MLTPVKWVWPAFFSYVLKSIIYIQALRRTTDLIRDGQELRFSNFAQVPLPVVPLDEQKVIAAFLNRETAKIDALIAEQEKLVALLAEKRQATISHAVTKGLNSNASMKDSGVTWLGEVPAHWDVVPLKYLVELRSGGTPSKDNLGYWGGDVPWASAKDLKVEKLEGTIDRITQQAVEDGAASLIRAGAVLVVVRGMILARMFPVVETVVPMAINQDLKAVLPLNSLNSSFLAWLLRGSAAESLQRLDEAGHGTKALRMDAWTSMQLPVPPLSEQVQLTEFISRETAKLDALRTESERAIDLLNERRSALITAAVTGQIDVRGAVSLAAVESLEAIAA